MNSSTARGSGSSRTARALPLALALLWTPGPVPAQSTPAPEAAKAPATLAAARAPRVHALLINGGGDRQRNFQSHLLHVRELIRLLERDGVATSDIVVFASDGNDPHPDLAVRDMQTEPDFWLIEGVWPGTLLDNRVRYENTTVGGVLLRPAKKKALRQWFTNQLGKFQAGDTLLVYVTDHGSKNKTDLTNNGIVLWGEELSVNEFRDILGILPDTVKVVMLMSQCFSGSFAHLMSATAGGTTPSGNVCGYFSATADRFAYGCYPENRGKVQVGHGFRFIDALGHLGSLPDAHARVLLTDYTPDVPHRTSDVYLEDVLTQEAARRNVTLEVLTDELLPDAWRNTVRFRDEVELLDRMADAFGAPRPESLADVDRQTDKIRRLRHRINAYVPRWRTALRDFKRENIERFVGTDPQWRTQFDPKLLKDINSSRKAALSEYFLEGLVEFIDDDRATSTRLEALHGKSEATQAVRYRMEVRLGVLLRMRSLLVRIAGLAYLDAYGTGPERLAFDQVGRCEDVSVRKPTAAAEREPTVHGPGLIVPDRYPPLPADVELVEAVTPGWLGIGFRAVDRLVAIDRGLERGAVQVLTVHTRSPAELGGIEVGDIILGPPDSHFADPYGIRSWSMLARPGDTHALAILRGEQSLATDVEIGHYPVDPY
jgi:hypothetical protein